LGGDVKTFRSRLPDVESPFLFPLETRFSGFFTTFCFLGLAVLNSITSAFPIFFLLFLLSGSICFAERSQRSEEFCKSTSAAFYWMGKEKAICFRRSRRKGKKNEWNADDCHPAFIRRRHLNSGDESNGRTDGHTWVRLMYYQKGILGGSTA
jgi:hypothetical protein